MKRRQVVILSSALVVAVLASAAHAQPALDLLPGDAAVSAAAGDQTAPAIAQGGNLLLAVWSDARANPTTAYEYETSKDIYGVRLDTAGNLLDPVPIAIFAGKSSQDNPKAAWNGVNWLVVFESYDLSGTGYYYQKSLAAVRVAPTGQVLDAAPIKLYGLTPAAAGYWAVASDGVNWVVANEGSSTSGDILAVRVSPDGVLLDPPTRTLVDATYYMRSNLKLAFAGGVFLLTFNDEYINGTDDSKAVRFDSNLNVLDAAPIALLGTPLSHLAGNSSGFYVVWHRQEPNYSVVVAGSRVSTTGAKLDGNGVNLSGTKQPYAYATTAVVWDGLNWRVTWGDGTNTWAARVNASGQVLDPGSVAVPGPQPGPSAGTGVGSVQLVWTVFTNNNYDVLSANIAANNTAGPNRTLSLGAPRQLRPDIATSGNGFMLVYYSSTSAQNRVLAQPLDANGVPLTPGPIELDAGNSSTGPSYPTVAWNGSLYLVVWGNANGIVAQRLLPDGTKVDAVPFVVMGGTNSAFGSADVAALGDHFLVAGRQIGFNIQYIFPVVARVRGSDGAVLDAAPLLLGNSFVGRVPAAVALGGRWLVAWHRNATHDDPYALTMGAFVNLDGTRTAEFQIHGPFSTAGGNGIFELGLASSGDVALMVQSQELSSGVETDLLGRLIKADDTVQPMVNLTPWSGNQYKACVAWDGANFIVVFQDQKNRLAEWTLDQLDARSDLFAMRVSPTGSIIDPQGFVLSASATGDTDPNITALDGVSLLAGSVVINDADFANYRVVYAPLDNSLNQQPVAVAAATPAGGDVPLAVSFSSAGSTDPDGAMVSYAWDFGDGTTSTQPNPSHTYMVAGPYVATLTVTDTAGATATQTALVQATNPNQPPVAVASANKTSGNAPLDVIFYADYSYDPDGFVGNIEWLFSDGGSYWGSTAYHTFTTTGPHTVTLRVYDSRGAIGTTTLTINVGGVNQPPIANAGATPTSGDVPLTVQFSSAGSSDPDGTITSYRWDFGDALGYTSSEPNPTYLYNYAGTYTATLTVTDDNNVSSTDTVTITVNTPPSQVLRSTAINLTAKLSGSKVTVTGTVSVKDGSGRSVRGAIVYATWTRPGGSTVTQSATTGLTGNARFSTSGGRGTYTLTVTNLAKSGYTFDPANSVLTKSIAK